MEPAHCDLVGLDVLELAAFVVTSPSDQRIQTRGKSARSTTSMFLDRYTALDTAQDRVGGDTAELFMRADVLWWGVGGHPSRGRNFPMKKGILWYHVAISLLHFEDEYLLTIRTFRQPTVAPELVQQPYVGEVKREQGLGLHQRCSMKAGSTGEHVVEAHKSCGTVRPSEEAKSQSAEPHEIGLHVIRCVGVNRDFGIIRSDRFEHRELICSKVRRGRGDKGSDRSHLIRFILRHCTGVQLGRNFEEARCGSVRSAERYAERHAFPKSSQHIAYGHF